MTLRIERIELQSFRNQAHFVLEPGENLTIITGANAAGKTNLIEAVQLVTAAESFRNPQWSEVVRWGDETARITMRATSDERVRDVTMEIVEGGRRVYRVNGSVKRKLSDVAGVLPAVMFTPDDLGMVKGTSERRRQALDEIGQQLSSTYRDIKTDFDRALRQRNAMLKEESIDSGLFEAWTDRFCELGAALGTHRIRLFERIAEPAARAYGEISGGEVLGLEYQASWWKDREESDDRKVAEASLREALEARGVEERSRRSTVAGPHRDDVAFTVDGNDARAYASQGQQRSIALAWKLAELEVVERVAGVEPVLLLDDVMSELDSARRDALSATVGVRAQTFITTTNLGYFDERLVAEAVVVQLGGA